MRGRGIPVILLAPSRTRITAKLATIRSRVVGSPALRTSCL